MAYNTKAKETNLKKYGHACSFWGKNGTLASNKELWLKSQKANFDRIENSKKRIIEALKENSIEVLDMPQDNHTKLYGTKLNYHCLKCGCTFSHIQRYKIPQCPNCKDTARRSKAEDEIFNFISSFYDGNIIKNDRSIIGPKEIDIWIPEKKLAIEYNGIYFHMINKQASAYEKYLLCKEKGIKLITIFDVQWSLEKTKIKKAIKTCIEQGGCVFLDENGNHNNQFPLYEGIKTISTFEPRKIFLKEYNKKCPKSQQEYFFIDCGALSICDLELSKTLNPNVFC